MSKDPLADATSVHEFFWFWYEWVRSPARRRQIDALTGLPESAWKILYKLRSSGPLSVTEIGRVVDLDKSTVSRHLEPLRAAHLIVETPGSHNRRVSEVSVSARGAALCDRVDDTHVQYWSDVLTHFPELERHELARLLGHLQVAMEQEPEMRAQAAPKRMSSKVMPPTTTRVRVETAPSTPVMS